ncbi:MAG: ATPase [Bacteroidales bacterium]|nr:ATPase [Bacteroidales bacterium]
MNKRHRFAIPTNGGILTAHFGHCEKFAIVDVEDGEVVSSEMVTPPVHQPGVYPAFLAGEGVSVIIAGGMGQKAQDLFAQNNIKVCMGVDGGDPAGLVKAYLKNELVTGDNLCDH